MYVIDYISGEDGWMLIFGIMFKLFVDLLGYVCGMYVKYGFVYWYKSFGGCNVILFGLDVNELVLFDCDKVFLLE